jgi:hypothetical protein
VVEHAIHAVAAVSWRTLERRAVRMAVVTVRPAFIGEVVAVRASHFAGQAVCAQ